MAERKILFICEGNNDEPHFLKKLMKESYPSYKYRIYSYRTTIHVLAATLSEYYPNFDNGETDIQAILREMEQNADRKQLLSETFTDIILAFDFEPQHDHPYFDIVRRMLLFYIDSSDMGKLYMNYPMMQSYKHHPSLPDNTFMMRTASPYHYKELVGKESKFTDLTKYDYRLFVSITLHHLSKAWKLCKSKNELPTVNDYCNMQWTDLFDIQLRKFQEDKDVYVLNTLLFSLIDYNPSAFFTEVHRHPQNYVFGT